MATIAEDAARGGAEGTAPEQRVQLREVAVRVQYWLAHLAVVPAGFVFNLAALLVNSWPDGLMA